MGQIQPELLLGVKGYLTLMEESGKMTASEFGG